MKCHTKKHKRLDFGKKWVVKYDKQGDCSHSGQISGDPKDGWEYYCVRCKKAVCMVNK